MLELLQTEIFHLVNANAEKNKRYYQLREQSLFVMAPQAPSMAMGITNKAATAIIILAVICNGKVKGQTRGNQRVRRYNRCITSR